MLPFDPVDQLRQSLVKDRRAPDGLLHCSSDIIGSLRHAQLTAAGAPRIESDVVSDTRMMIGTLTHRWLESAFRGAPVLNEVKLDEWLPEGWTGTADAFFWNAERKGFVLVDYKSCKPTAIPFIHRDGIKDTHMAQASAYWWAAKKMGIPLVKGFGVLYIPIEQLRASDGYVQPTFQEATPWPLEEIEPSMCLRWTLTQLYLDSIRMPPSQVNDLPLGDFLSDALAPVQERVQKLMAAKKDKPNQRDLILVPHWSAAFCPFPESLCDCRNAGTTKIGHYLDGEYIARKGYEDIEPSVG